MIRAENLRFSWPAGPAVRGLSLAVGRGEMAAVVGPNGAGKSTLLRLLSGYLKPAGGRVVLNGRDIAAHSRREVARIISFVPQYSDVNLPYTVADLVALARYPHLGPFRQPGPADRAAAARAMAWAGVVALADRPVSQLSGGEFQRAVLARALAVEPDLILLDEPTTHLDLSHEARMFELLSLLNRERGLTVIAVLHDLNFAAAYFPRVALMAGGEVVADGPPAAVLTPEVLSSVYGCPITVAAVGGRRFIFPAVVGGNRRVRK